MSPTELILDEPPAQTFVVKLDPSWSHALPRAPVRLLFPGSVRRASMPSAAVARLLVFWRKYRWYRVQGYPRAVAREKAWWHAREAPCPLVMAMRSLAPA